MTYLCWTGSLSLRPVLLPYYLFMGYTLLLWGFNPYIDNPARWRSSAAVGMQYSKLTIRYVTYFDDWPFKDGHSPLCKLLNCLGEKTKQHSWTVQNHQSECCLFLRLTEPWPWNTSFAIRFWKKMVGAKTIKITNTLAASECPNNIKNKWRKHMHPPKVVLKSIFTAARLSQCSRCVNAAVWIFSSLQQSNSGFADIFTLAGWKSRVQSCTFYAHGEGWGGANNVLVALHTYVRSRVFAHIGNATLWDLLLHLHTCLGLRLCHRLLSFLHSLTLRYEICSSMFLHPVTLGEVGWGGVGASNILNATLDVNHWPRFEQSTEKIKFSMGPQKE